MALRRALAGAVVTALVFACGCGSSGQHKPSASKSQPKPEPGSLHVEAVAALGDSITAGSPGWAPAPALRAQIANPDPQSQYEYWAKRGLDGSTITNCGVPGQRTDQIATRLDECTQGADAVIIQGGTNDLAQGVPVSKVAANLKAMAEQAKRLGLQVFMATVLPTRVSALFAPIQELNQKIRELCSQLHVTALPFYATLVGTGAEEGALPQSITVDGVHPTVDGYKALGAMVAQQLQAAGIK